MGALPGIVFDWVIDTHFQEIATWHPAVGQIYPTDHRNWQKELFRVSTVHQVSDLVHMIRKRSYDLVLDGQGNFKTALLSLCMKGTRAGFDRHSVREWVAHLAYQNRYAVTKKAHAIERLRSLFAQSLRYPIPSSAPDFHIRRECFVPPFVTLPRNYLVFIHSASWKTKLWPESYWIELIKRVIADGWHVLLPWGSLEEEKRAHRLAIAPQVQVLPKLTLSQVGYVLAEAKACVSVDTGLSHLAAALGVFSVALYGPTHVGRVGTVGLLQSHLVSSVSCAPCQKKICPLSSIDPPCLGKITPDVVYGKMQNQLESIL